MNYDSRFTSAVITPDGPYLNGYSEKRVQSTMRGMAARKDSQKTWPDYRSLGSGQ